MPYEPTTLSGNYKTFQFEGWYHMVVKEVVPGKSKNGYSQLRIVSEICEGEYSGCQSWYFMVIPTLKKAYALITDAEGKERIDRNKPTFWLRQTGWTFWVFDIDLEENNKEPENLMALQNLDNLDELVDRIVGKLFVARLAPKKYEKEVTDDEGKTFMETRVGAEMVEIRMPSYVPDEGFIDDALQPPIPPVRQPEHNSTDITPEMSRNPADVPLDPDTDLEEEEDFYV